PRGVAGAGGVGVLHPPCPPPPLVRAGALLLGGMTAAAFWTPRPQMFSYVGTAVVVWVAMEWKDGRDRLWLLPPLMLVWAQLHAGWALGFLILGLAVVGGVLVRRPRRGVLRLAGFTPLGALVLVGNTMGLSVADVHDL